MASTVHIVKQGECLHRLAKQYGFADWKTIYEHEDNAELREKRPNPNALYPGDEVHIPEKERKDLALPTTTKHKLQIQRPRVMLRVEIRDESDEPVADKAFELAFGKKLYEGTTNGDGILEQKVEQSEEAGELTVWLTDDREAERYMWEIRVGHLDPVAETVGVRQRLNNLGFYCEEDGDEIDESLRLALRGFQDIAGMETTGELDDATRDELVQMHGNL